MPPLTEFRQQTLRQSARVTLDGDTLHFKFSNVFGRETLTLNKITVAHGDGAATIDTGTVITLTCNGLERVDIPPGAEIWCDPVQCAVTANSTLTVSLYIQQASIATAHRFALQHNYIAPGDQTAAATLTDTTSTGAWYCMTEIAVTRTAPANVVVAFGDSLTDGVGSTVGANRRYPDRLQQRLLATTAGAAVTVVNAGIGGNRWLTDVRGPKGINRLQRDVLNVSGVTHAILQLGINDIGKAALYSEPVSTGQIIAAITAAITACRASGITVLVGTLLPCQGAFFYTDAGERQRQAINTWLRTGAHSANAIIDFDQAMQHPDNPLALRPEYDSGDHLHPGDAGYARMANTIDLALLYK